MNERKVGTERDLEQILAAIDGNLLLTLFDDRPNSCWGQNATQPGTGSTDALNQRPLRNQVHLQVTLNHLLLCFFVKADVAGDQLAKELRADEFANSDPRKGSVVGDHREVALALPHQLIDQRLGGTAAHKTSDHQARSMGDHVGRFLHRNRFHAVLRSLSSTRKVIRLVEPWNGPTP